MRHLQKKALIRTQKNGRAVTTMVESSAHLGVEPVAQLAIDTRATTIGSGQLLPIRCSHHHDFRVLRVIFELSHHFCSGYGSL
jgi:hypothetical protein